MFFADVLLLLVLDIYMGNTSSDSLDHSFKRLRLSQTEQLSLGSPSSSSPKRKIASNINKDLGGISNNTINDTSDRSPVILYDDAVYSCATALPTLECSKADTRKNSAASYHFKSDRASRAQLSTTSINNNHENDSANGELSDQEIIMCLRSKMNSDLSDIDIVDCLKKIYINK